MKSMAWRPALLLVLLGLLVLACNPPRGGRGGGGDDDDDAGDDDDFEPEGVIRLSSEATGEVTLPGMLGVIWHSNVGRQTMVLAGDDVGCSPFEFYAYAQFEAWLDYEEGLIDMDEYARIVGDALIELLGPSSWAVLVQVEGVRFRH